VSVWNVNDVAASLVLAMGSWDTPNIIGIFPRTTGTNEACFYVNSLDSAATNLSNTNTIGHFVASRNNSATTVAGYKNGTQLDSSPENSTTLINLNLYLCGHNRSGTAVSSLQQEAAASIGAGLSGAQALALYNRLRTYMTAVGVP